MARPPQITRQSLEPLLLQRGPVSATELADTLAVNRSSIVRALDAVFGPELATLGATRSTRYALRREVFMAGNQWPIYAIDETGRPRHWATVEVFHDRRWRVAWRSESGAPEWAAPCSRDIRIAHCTARRLVSALELAPANVGDDWFSVQS